MATISTLRERLSSINVSEEAETAIDESSDVIVREQKDQLLHGERADGDKIGRYRSNKYARVKNEMNPLPGLGYMDWRVTGTLHNEIFIDVRPQTFILDSADEKTSSLIDRFGDPFGLTLESRIIVIKEKLRPVLVTNIKKKLGLWVK